MSEVMNALFTQQRIQILDVYHSGSGIIDGSYAYAWTNSIYPYYHDQDDSVPRMPHSNFEEYFHTKKEFVHEVIDYTETLWNKDESPTFYELEDNFGGRDCRSSLIDIFRYAYLSGRFNDRLWNKIEEPMQHPTEAHGISGELHPEEIHL